MADEPQKPNLRVAPVQLPPSEAGPRPRPTPAPGRSTADPRTPTRRELAQRAARATLAQPLPSEARDVVDPQWTAPGGGFAAPAPGQQPSAGGQLTPQQQKLKDVKALLQQAPTGAAALKVLDAHNVRVGFASGGGSYWDGKKIVLDQTQSTDEAALTLVHEVNHAVATITKTGPDAAKLARVAYVGAMVQEEAVGTVQSIVTKRELVAAGVPITATFPLESQFTGAYDQAAAALAKADPTASAAARAAAGAKAGLARVVQGFTNGEVVTSTNNTPYPDYYGGHWDTVNPKKKKGP